MNWSKTPRILLVFPRRERFDLDTLDLKLLQRHAHSLGAELGLVTKSLKVIRSAETLNIPTFPDNLAAQRGAWPSQRRQRIKRRNARPDLRKEQKEVRVQEAAWRSHPAVRLGTLTLVALTLLGLFATFIPSAEIVLEPERLLQSITIPVRASSEVQDVFIAGSIPAHTVRVEFTEKRSIAASSQIAVPSKGASGSITFRNLTDQTIRVPKGTVIRSIEDASIRFETDFEAIVNAGVDEDIEVPVSALSFGESGNLDVDLLQAIEGELRFSLAATNPEPTTGGSDEFVSVPALQDREELHDQLLFQINQQIENEIRNALNETDVLFVETITPLEVLEEKYTPEEAEPSERLTLEMDVAVEAEYAATTDIESLAQAALSASLPQNYIAELNSLTYAPIGDFETDTFGVTTWQMRVEQSLSPMITSAEIGDLVKGQGLEQAEETIEAAFALTRPPVIKISPSWWSWLPIAPFRVEVTVK